MFAGRPIHSVSPANTPGMPPSQPRPRRRRAKTGCGPRPVSPPCCRLSCAAAVHGKFARASVNGTRLARLGRGLRLWRRHSAARRRPQASSAHCFGTPRTWATDATNTAILIPVPVPVPTNSALLPTPSPGLAATQSSWRQVSYVSSARPHGVCHATRRAACGAAPPPRTARACGRSLHSLSPDAHASREWRGLRRVGAGWSGCAP